MNYGTKPEHEGDVNYGHESAHDLHWVKVTEISLPPFIVVGVCVLVVILYSKYRKRT